MKQETKGAKVHVASLMDICHLKNAELEAKHQKYKGRVVFRGDIVKDDSGSYAAFTEQGSSASQMTAAKVMDIISRLPRCAGQAADAVSAFSQVKWKVLQNYLKFPNRNVQTYGFVHHDTNGPKQVQYGRPSRARNFDRIDGEPMEFEWNIFPGFNTLQLSEEVKRLLLRLDETPENFTGRIIFMSMFTDISCGSKDNEKECLAKAQTRVSVCKEIWKRTMVIHWSWF